MFASPFDSFSRSAELWRELNAMAVEETEDFMKRQQALTELVSNTSRQVTKAYENVGAAHTPLEWADAFKTNLRSLVEVTRDCMVATADYSTANVMRMQKQAMELQKILTGSLQETASSGSSKPSTRAAR